MADGSVGEAQDKAHGEAQDKAQEVAGQAQEKAREAAGKAQEGIRQQLDSRSTQAGEQVSSTAQDIRSVGEELRKQGKEGPAKLADRAAEQTEKVGSYLKDKGADEMLRDAEDFGRRRPWAVLAGGMALGVVAARFLKASSRNRYQQQAGRRPVPQVPRTTSPPVNRSAVEPVATPPPPSATPTPTPTPVTPSAAP